MTPQMELLQANAGPKVGKPNRHVVIALRHLNQRMSVLLEKSETIQREIAEVKAAIDALNL